MQTDAPLLALRGLCLAVSTHEGATSDHFASRHSPACLYPQARQPLVVRESPRTMPFGRASPARCTAFLPQRPTAGPAASLETDGKRAAFSPAGLEVLPTALLRPGLPVRRLAPMPARALPSRHHLKQVQPAGQRPAACLVSGHERRQEAAAARCFSRARRASSCRAAPPAAARVAHGGRIPTRSGS